MVIWTALLLGALGGMAGFVSSPHPWQKPANSLEVVHEDDGLFGPARPDQDRTRVRALSRDDGGKWTEYRQDVPAAAAVLPRILTVLTTYGKRSALVKEYKEAVLNRDDGLHPEVSWLIFSGSFWFDNEALMGREVSRHVRHSFRAFADLACLRLLLSHPGIRGKQCNVSAPSWLAIPLVIAKTVGNCRHIR